MKHCRIPPQECDMNTTPHTLAATGLSKSYKNRAAVADLSLTLKPGEIVGLLGPNGAGKSTTIGMLCGIIAPDRGEVLLDGKSLYETEHNANLKRRIGVVPQDIALFEELSAQVNLEIFGALYGLSGATLTTQIESALALVGLQDRARDKPATFSGGMKRRLNIAAALIHDPDIILLDEPTVGIDPQSRNAIFDNLETLKARGKALIYSTHYMEEAERLCDHIVIMDHGKVIANDTINNLYRMLPAANVLDIETDRPVNLQLFEGMVGVSKASLRHTKNGTSEGNNALSFAVDSLATSTPAILAMLAAHSINVTHLASQRATLESLFLNLTGRALRDD